MFHPEGCDIPCVDPSDCSPGVTWIGRIAKIHCPCRWVLKLRSTSSFEDHQCSCSHWFFRCFLSFRYLWCGAFTIHLPFIYHSFTLPGYEKRSDGFHCAAGYVGAVEVSRMSSFGKPWCVFSIVQWHPYCLGSPNSCWCQWSICWVNSHVTWRLKTNVWGIFEGSLEVKLPTIWTDEKQSRAEAERRERLEERRSEKRKSQKK